MSNFMSGGYCTLCYYTGITRGIIVTYQDNLVIDFNCDYKKCHFIDKCKMIEDFKNNNLLAIPL